MPLWQLFDRYSQFLTETSPTAIGSEFVHMDYGDAIEVLEWSNQKFEFPVARGVDLQSEHERYLTENYAKNRSS